MSPRSRVESLISFLVKELTKKNIKAISVYKMADPNNLGSASSSAIEASFKKILPTIAPELIAEAMYGFKALSPNDKIKREDFETLFNEETS